MTGYCGRRGSAVLSLGVALAAAKGPAQVPHVEVSLVPDVVTLQAGQAFHVAVRLDIPLGWHLFWINPGQSGLPTTLSWRLPAGIEAGAVAWSIPERAETAGIVSHTYRGAAAALQTFRVVAGAAPGPVTLVAGLEWGICREICIPQSRVVRLTLPVTTGAMESSPSWGGIDSLLRATLPGDTLGLSVRAVHTARGVELRLRDPSPATSVLSATFFPALPKGAVAERLVPRAGQKTLVYLLLSVGPGRVVGVLVLESSNAARRAIWIDVPVEGAGER